MLRYTLKRLFQTVIVLIGVTLVTFIMVNVVPGDPAAVMLQKLLRLPGDAAVFAPDDDSAVPTWAQSAVSALSTAGIPLSSADYEGPLTRREAANMLFAAAPAAKAAGLYWTE